MGNRFTWPRHRSVEPGRLALVTTCRPTYRTAIWRNGGPKNQQTLFGFDSDDVEQALAKYFESYKITADTTLAPLVLFRLPIYLKLFCEITNPGRETEVEAYIGQQTLYEVFDQYLVSCNDLVSSSLGKRPESKIAIDALAKIADYLWTNNSRFVSLDDAYSIIDGQSLKDIVLETSVTDHLLNEGLLIERDLLADEEGIQFTYDLMGGFLIASYLIEENQTGLQTFIQLPDTTRKLFGDDLGGRHPLADDIGRGLAALLPQRFEGTYLHEVVDLPQARRLSCAALFEIAADLVNQNAVDYVTQLFADESERRLLFALASAAVSQTNHPLNAAYWSERLKTLALADRDLTWTEHVRRNVLLFEQLAMQLKTASQHSEISEVVERRAHLIASWLRWALTSSTPTLRDVVTQALYYYGRRWPDRLFQLLQDSFGINDPYVWERMLAVMYGVAMARQYDVEDRSFTTELLPKVTTCLCAAMFAPGAEHATTHFLARDYAWRTIDLALARHPGLLSPEEVQRMRPPFQDGGIRAWGAADDQGKGRYRDGNHPLSRYHVGPIEDPMTALGPGGQHAGSGEYHQLRSYLWWRLYELGYSMGRFGDVDVAIMHDRPEVGWGLEKWLTNPYGRKYALIATYELAGFLDDTGKLRFDQEESPLQDRPPFTDLDPSFPIAPRQCDVNRINLLGDPALPDAEWLKARNDPDVQGYAIQDSFCGHDGPWVLLGAHLVQQEPRPGRDAFFYTTGLIVHADAIDKLESRLKRRTGAVRNASTVPATVYTFAGEIPWSDTYRPNGQNTLLFQTGTDPAERLLTQPELWRGDAQVPEDEANELMRAFFGQAFREERARPDSEIGLDVRIGKIAESQGFALKTIAVIETYQQPVYEEFEGLVAVTRHGWENYHSTMNPELFCVHSCARNHEHLCLVGQSQTFDLFERDQQLASLSFQPTEGTSEFSQTMTYIRKDLIDRFLGETNSDLLWLIWGERQVLPPDDSSGTRSLWRQFQSVHRYGVADPAT